MTDSSNSSALSGQDCRLSGSCRADRSCTCRQPRKSQGGLWAIQLLPARPYRAGFRSTAPSIGFAFDSQCGDHAFASDRLRPFRTRPNSLAFVPTACDVISQSHDGGEYLKLTVTASGADPIDDHWNQARMFNDRIDERAISAAQAIRKLLLGIGPPDRLLLEAHAETLAECVDDALAAPNSPRGAERWMTPARLRTIDDLIESHLDRALTVASLARTLGLSPGFFSRAFRAAVGKAPHDHIIDRRIARARMLMRDTPHTLSAVALSSGFSSHAHMSAAFRTRLGATPGQIRRSR